MYSTAKIFVLPSYSENFGNTVLEAMIRKVPVCITPEVGLADEVISSGAGQVVAGNPEDFGNAIRGMINNQQLLDNMGEKGFACAIEKYSWDKIGTDMARAYSNLVNASHA